LEKSWDTGFTRVDDSREEITDTMSILATILALLTIPLVILLWATESKQQRARRWRKSGYTYRSIAQHMNVSQTTARRWCQT
jgi:ABC-type spermidine/putrescine transport system permease subunit II